jgi:hypothetical protein
MCLGSDGRLTPKSLSKNARNSSSFCNTGSSHTLDNHLCNEFLTSLSSIQTQTKKKRECISPVRGIYSPLSAINEGEANEPSSSVTAEVFGNGNAGTIAVYYSTISLTPPNFHNLFETLRSIELTMRIGICHLFGKRLKFSIRPLHVLVQRCSEIR